MLAIFALSSLDFKNKLLCIVVRSNVDVLADPAWQCGCMAEVMICNVDYKELKCLRKNSSNICWLNSCVTSNI
jgi:hypothetical protein